MCSLLLDITASRPFLWTESGNTQFLKNEFTLVLSIHIPHHRVLPYLFPFLICISLLYSKNTISKQYQYITHLPYPKTVSKLTPIPLPITNPKSSFSFIALFVLTISLKSVKVTWINFFFYVTMLSIWYILSTSWFSLYSFNFGDSFFPPSLFILCISQTFTYLKSYNYIKKVYS